MTPPSAFLSPVESETLESAEASSGIEVLDPEALSVTEPFVGQWNTLISQTNWEKGKIIFEWRAALIESGANPSVFSDETWSRQVGAVTSQHVGRLRRVFERFGSTYTSFPGLYWSHFLAGLDWDDAELWLEGAMRSKWSISEMRKMRWESSGGDPKHAPRDEELITSEVDEGFDALTQEDDEESDRESRDRAEASGPLSEGPDFGEEEYEDYDPSPKSEGSGSESDSGNLDGGSDIVNPFASLPSLPPDIDEALEQFKLSIVRHRASGWGDISQSQMIQVLDALKLFAMR